MSVLGKVEKVKASQPQSTPTTAKKTKHSESPKPSASKKKSSSSRPSADDLKQLDDKWAERFSRLEAMLLAKTFTVPVVKPASDVTTSQKPFFDPGATTSSKAAVNSGPCLDQATGEAVNEMHTATQPLEAPSAGTATQPVQAPGSVPDVQPTGEGDLSAASDSEADQLSVTGSLDDEIHRDRSPDRDVTRDEADQEPTEEANYRETMPLPVHVFSLPVKSLSLWMTGCVGRCPLSTSPSQKGIPPGTPTILASSGISLLNLQDLPDGTRCMLRRAVRV